MNQNIRLSISLAVYVSSSHSLTWRSSWFLTYFRQPMPLRAYKLLVWYLNVKKNPIDLAYHYCKFVEVFGGLPSPDDSLQCWVFGWTRLHLLRFYEVDLRSTSPWKLHWMGPRRKGNVFWSFDAVSAANAQTDDTCHSPFMVIRVLARPNIRVWNRARLEHVSFRTRIISLRECANLFPSDHNFPVLAFNRANEIAFVSVCCLQKHRKESSQIVEKGMIRYLFLIIDKSDFDERSRFA